LKASKVVPVLLMNDGHVELAIGGEDLQPILLLLPNFEGELDPTVGIVEKKTEWITWTTERVSSGPRDTCGQAHTPS